MYCQIPSGDKITPVKEPQGYVKMWWKITPERRSNTDKPQNGNELEVP